MAGETMRVGYVEVFGLGSILFVVLLSVAVGCRSRNAAESTEPTTADRPELTPEEAKNALVDMLRRLAARDPKRCLEVWGSTEPDRR
jgi:hypothetical protein